MSKLKQLVVLTALLLPNFNPSIRGDAFVRGVAISEGELGNPTKPCLKVLQAHFDGEINAIIVQGEFYYETNATMSLASVNVELKTFSPGKPPSTTRKTLVSIPNAAKFYEIVSLENVFVPVYGICTFVFSYEVHSSGIRYDWGEVRIGDSIDTWSNGSQVTSSKDATLDSVIYTYDYVKGPRSFRQTLNVSNYDILAKNLNCLSFDFRKLSLGLDYPDGNKLFYPSKTEIEAYITIEDPKDNYDGYFSENGKPSLVLPLKVITKGSPPVCMFGFKNNQYVDRKTGKYTIYNNEAIKSNVLIFPRENEEMLRECKINIHVRGLALSIPEFVVQFPLTEILTFKELRDSGDVVITQSFDERPQENGEVVDINYD